MCDPNRQSTNGGCACCRVPSDLVTLLRQLFLERVRGEIAFDEVVIEGNRKSVEAAMDDTNLGRLLEIYEELRETSQLLVITHQKRTMEVADALYGVTMRAGVTQVISQRLKHPED